MKPRNVYHLKERKHAEFQSACRLEWITIFFLITIGAAMYWAMGQSQAMKAAWIEDLLSLVPPIVFLASVRYMDRHPDASFPDGFRRVATLAFLVSATAVLTLGLYILIDSAIKLITRHHPSIPMMQVFGHQVWAGWVMIPVLVYSAIPPIVLGHMKLPLAKKLHDRTLFADADMNKADWQTALAAIIGIVLVGFGFWWGDAVAAGLISLNICKDGAQTIISAFSQLLNQRPMDVEGKNPDTEVEQLIRRTLAGFDWIEDVRLRLHEDGHLISGLAFVKIAGDRAVSAEMVDAARTKLAGQSWRIYCVELVPVSDLK